MSTLSEVRFWVMIYQEEIDNLNIILTPLICHQNQSIYQYVYLGSKLKPLRYI